MNPTSENSDLLQRVENILKHSPPGKTNHRALTPDMGYGRHRGPPHFDTRAAAVMILLIPNGETWGLPLIVRPTQMLTHGGQVSFPGGELMFEESYEQGAVREFNEELGILPDPLRILGRLTPLFVFASNFWVTPIVAATDHSPNFCPNPREVSSILMPKLTLLLNPDCLRRRTVIRRGVSLDAPGYVVDGSFIWGATAMMLAEFLAVVEET